MAPAVTSTSLSGSYCQSVEALLVGDDRLAQHRHSRPGRVLVQPTVDGVDGGVEHLAGPVGVGEALAEVDAAGGRRERRHLGEDRGAEALQLGGEVRRS